MRNPYTSEKIPPLSRFGRDENVASGSLKCALSKCRSSADRSEFKYPALRSSILSILLFSSLRTADPMELELTRVPQFSDAAGSEMHGNLGPPRRLHPRQGHDGPSFRFGRDPQLVDLLAQLYLRPSKRWPYSRSVMAGSLCPILCARNEAPGPFKHTVGSKYSMRRLTCGFSGKGWCGGTKGRRLDETSIIPSHRWSYPTHWRRVKLQVGALSE